MTERAGEPNVAELQQTALAARNELFDSLSRLDRRVKHMAGNAANATAASAWGVAAACAWWLSIAVDGPRRPTVDKRHARSRRSGAVLRTALKAAGFVVTGVMLYSAYRRARRLSEGGRAPVTRLPAPRVPAHASTAGAPNGASQPADTATRIEA